MASLPWKDIPTHYGRASRWLHWGIGALLIWQLGGMAAKVLWGHAPWVQAWLSTHRPLGTLLLGLIALRALWALINLPRRPAHPGKLGRIVAFSHLLLYLLMLGIPALGLYMTWLSGQPFTPLGIPLFDGGSANSNRMMVAHHWHSWLGWTLLTLIVVHAGIALLWHGLIRRDGTIRRMTGPRRR